MREGRQEFGKRGRVEVARPPEPRDQDFEKERPMYERPQDAQIAKLLEDIDSIQAFIDAGHVHPDDTKRLETLKLQVAERYEMLKGRH